MRQFTIQLSYWMYWLSRLPRVIRWIRRYSSEFKNDIRIAEERNNKRFSEVKKIDLPEVEYLDIDVFLESKAVPGKGYKTDCGVSYKLTTDKGSLLMDLGFGCERDGVVPNALRQGFELEQVEGIIITHNHWDHMGGMQNVKDDTVRVPEELGSHANKPCWTAQPAGGEGLNMHFVDKPQELACCIYSTGPISRGLFSLGCTEEQIILVNVRNKGLVVITGCGHPSLMKIFQMVKLISDLPIYAVVGGLHLPIRESRITREGIRLQFVIGHGYSPFRRLTKRDLYANINEIKINNVKKLLLSSHDTDDYAIKQFARSSGADTEPLMIGKKYRI